MWIDKRREITNGIRFGTLETALIISVTVPCYPLNYHVNQFKFKNSALHVNLSMFRDSSDRLMIRVQTGRTKNRGFIPESCKRLMFLQSVQTRCGTQSASSPRRGGEWGGARRCERPSLAANHTTPHSVEIKSKWSNTSTPPDIFIVLKMQLYLFIYLCHISSLNRNPALFQITVVEKCLHNVLYFVLWCFTITLKPEFVTP
jgi:hypothetical protein